MLDEALELTWQRPWSTWWSATLPLALIGVMSSILSVRFSNSALTSPDDVFGSCGEMVLLLALVPVVMAVMVVAYGALAVSAVYRVNGYDPGPAACLRFTLRPTVFLTLSLGLIAVAGVAIVTFFLLGLPGLLVAMLFSWVVPVMVEEGNTGPGALGRSASLVWQSREGSVRRSPLPRLLALGLVYIAIGYGLSLIIVLPYQLLIQFLSFRIQLDPTGADIALFTKAMWIQVPITFFNTFAASWVAWYACHALALFYRDSRSRREGGDLETWIRRLEGTPSGTVTTVSSPLASRDPDE